MWFQAGQIRQQSQSVIDAEFGALGRRYGQDVGQVFNLSRHTGSSGQVENLSYGGRLAPLRCLS